MNFRGFSRATLRPMKGVPRALGATPWLAAIVVVLLPTLAWLQYDWVNQLATADRERRQRTPRAAGSQFTLVEHEVGRRERLLLERLADGLQFVDQGVPDVNRQSLQGFVQGWHTFCLTGRLV